MIDKKNERHYNYRCVECADKITCVIFVKTNLSLTEKVPPVRCALFNASLCRWLKVSEADFDEADCCVNCVHSDLIDDKSVKCNCTMHQRTVYIYTVCRDYLEVSDE